MNSQSFSFSRRDLWLLTVLTLSWGVNWPIMKIGVSEMEPMTFRMVCMSGGMPLLWLVVRSQGVSLKIPREHWREFGWLVLTNMLVWFILVMYGVKLLDSGRAAILGYTMPVWAAIFGIVVFRERPSPRLALGVVAAAIGVALLLAGEFSAITGSPLGTILMLVAAMVWGFGTHLMRRRRQPTSVLTITFWSQAIVLLVCSLLALLLERDHWRWPPSGVGWAAIIYNAVVIFGFSQAIWFRIASTLPPVASGLSVMLIPVTGLFSGMALLSETPRWQDWFALGSILVAMAAVLLPAGSLARLRARR